MQSSLFKDNIKVYCDEVKHMIKTKDKDVLPLGKWSDHSLQFLKFN